MNARAFSLLLCTVSSEVQLFLRKSRAGNGCRVGPGSKHAHGRPAILLVAYGR